MPALMVTHICYWSAVKLEGVELYPRDYRFVYGWNTNDGLALVGVNWALSQFPKLPAGVEESFFQVVDSAAPGLAARLRAGKREERWYGGAIPGFFRKPYGEGWALVGDAGYKKDPCTAAGITDAFRDAEFLAEAIDDRFVGRRSSEQAMAKYELRRNAIAMPIYEFTCQSAKFEPATLAMKQPLTALRSNRSAPRSRFRASSTRSLWELRPTTSLAGLFAKRGKLDEARDARRHLQLVHRGLQHRRPEGRQELLPDFPRTKYLAESEKFGAQTNRLFV